jgi:hypothetical protein
MKKVLTLFAVTAAFAFADNWSGTLIDQSCYDQQNSELKDSMKAADACAANSTSNAFALEVGGKVYKLDAASSAKAAAAFKNRADRTAPGEKPGKIMAKVSGTESAGTIKADSVELQ